MKNIKKINKLLLIYEEKKSYWWKNFNNFDIEQEKKFMKNYKYESYFIKEYCNDEELKIFQEAIDIAYISPRACFMMLRFFLETVFKRKITIWKFYQKTKLKSELEKFKQNYQKLTSDPNKEKTLKRIDEIINLVKNPNDENLSNTLSNTFNTYFNKKAYALIDYRSIGSFNNIFENIDEIDNQDPWQKLLNSLNKNQQNLITLGIKECFSYLNTLSHKNVPYQTPIYLMLMNIDIILLFLEKFLENPKNLENLNKKGANYER